MLINNPLLICLTVIHLLISNYNFRAAPRWLLTSACNIAPGANYLKMQSVSLFWKMFTLRTFSPRYSKRSVGGCGYGCYSELRAPLSRSGRKIPCLGSPEGCSGVLMTKIAKRN